jgi:hypothetical protein
LAAKDDSAGIRIFSIPELREELLVPIPANGTRDPWKFGFSPGGRYLTSTTYGRSDFCHLEVRDLETGGLVGRTKLQPDPRSADHSPIDGFLIQSQVFSPDGRELAILFEKGTVLGVVVVDCTTGRISTNFQVDQPRSQARADFRKRGPLLEWFPDGQRWLYRRAHVLDRASGSFTTTLPVDTRDSVPQQRCVVDDQTVLLPVVEGESVTLRRHALPLAGRQP